jgi:hypothetical protein
MKTNPTPRALAAAIVKTYIRSYAEIGEDNVTQSAVVTDAVPAAIKSLSNLGQALARTIGAHRPTLSLIRAQVQSYEYADYVDMVHFGRLVATRIPASSIRLLGKAVARHAKAAVIANKSRGAAVADSNGISMWFPADRATYLSFRAKYLALNFARDHRGWVEFLDAYHG